MKFLINAYKSNANVTTKGRSAVCFVQELHSSCTKHTMRRVYISLRITRLPKVLHMRQAFQTWIRQVGLLPKRTNFPVGQALRRHGNIPPFGNKQLISASQEGRE